MDQQCCLSSRGAYLQDWLQWRLKCKLLHAVCGALYYDFILYYIIYYDFFILLKCLSIHVTIVLENVREYKGKRKGDKKRRQTLMD